MISTAGWIGSTRVAMMIVIPPGEAAPGRPIISRKAIRAGINDGGRAETVGWVERSEAHRSRERWASLRSTHPTVSARPPSLIPARIAFLEIIGRPGAASPGGITIIIATLVEPIQPAVEIIGITPFFVG